MEKENFNKERDDAVRNNELNPNRLQWGEHNPKLTADNFIDRPIKNNTDRNKIIDKRI